MTDAWLRFAVAAHLQGRLHPCRGAVFDPHSFPVRDHRDSPVAVHKVVDVPGLLLVVRFPQLPCVCGDSRAPTPAARGKDRRDQTSSFPVVTQRSIPMVQPVWRTKEISQLQFAPGG